MAVLSLLDKGVGFCFGKKFKIMYKYSKATTTAIKRNKSYVGESIEAKVRRVTSANQIQEL